MDIRILIENTLPDSEHNLHPEHGLSVYIRYGSQRILMDTGRTGAFADNAMQMGVDLSEVDFVVLSHGHFDHGGGLERFFQLNDRAPVYMHPGAPEHFELRLFYLRKDISMERDLLSRHRDRIRLLAENTIIAPGIHILTGIPNRYGRPRGNRLLYRIRDGKSVHDDFAHELMLALETEKSGEFVLLTGCSHNGIPNMVDAAKNTAGIRVIRTVVGGFHFKGFPVGDLFSETRSGIEQTGQLLLEQGVEQIYTCHCTGGKGFQILKGVLGEKVQWLATGEGVTID